VNLQNLCLNGVMGRKLKNRFSHIKRNRRLHQEAIRRDMIVLDLKTKLLILAAFIFVGMSLCGNSKCKRNRGQFAAAIKAVGRHAEA
jgi:hypothetical protein